MRSSSFLLIAIISVTFGLSVATGLGMFAYRSYLRDPGVSLAPYLVLSGSVFLALTCVLLFVTGFISLGQRHLSDMERIAWVLVMLVFPVLGAGVFFLVSPGALRTR